MVSSQVKRQVKLLETVTKMVINSVNHLIIIRGIQVVVTIKVRPQALKLQLYKNGVKS